MGLVLGPVLAVLGEELEGLYLCANMGMTVSIKLATIRVLV